MSEQGYPKIRNIVRGKEVDPAGGDWYVGGVNDGTARTVALSFDFLDAGKTYTATIFQDGIVTEGVWRKPESPLLYGLLC